MGKKGKVDGASFIIIILDGVCRVRVAALALRPYIFPLQKARSPPACLLWWQSGVREVRGLLRREGPAEDEREGGV